MRSSLFLALTLAVLLLTGCSALLTAAGRVETQAPTPDLDALRTEVVQTVESQFTLAAVLSPSNTPLSATSTAASSATAQFTNTPFATVPVPATMTLPPKATSTRVSGGGGGVAKPTRTPYTDMIQYITQTPADGTVFTVGQDFDIVWTVKNIGMRTWNKTFYIRYKSGVEGSRAKMYYLTNEVPVGDTIDIRVDMIAPYIPGRYVTTWQLVNDDAVVIGTLNLLFDTRE